VWPGGTVDAGRQERVVHVADREDPYVERNFLGTGGARIARAVEPLVVASHETMDDPGKPAELA